MGKIQPEERYVQELFARHYGALGVELKKIPESSEQTADFEVLLHGAREAVLEVKTIEETPRDAAHGWQPYGTGTGTTRDDRSPDRVGRLIAKAAKQLGNYAELKVLVFVNKEYGMHKSALIDAYNGTVLMGDDKVGYINGKSPRRLQPGQFVTPRTRSISTSGSTASSRVAGTSGALPRRQPRNIVTTHPSSS